MTHALAMLRAGLAAAVFALAIVPADAAARQKGKSVKVTAPYTAVDADGERVRVRAPHTRVAVDDGRVRVRAPYVNIDITW